jgi:hypothetical protein
MGYMMNLSPGSFLEWVKIGIVEKQLLLLPVDDVAGILIYVWLPPLIVSNTGCSHKTFVIAVQVSVE